MVDVNGMHRGCSHMSSRWEAESSVWVQVPLHKAKFEIPEAMKLSLKSYCDCCTCPVVGQALGIVMRCRRWVVGQALQFPALRSMGSQRPMRSLRGVGVFMCNELR